MTHKHYLLWVGLGIAAGLILNTTIAGVVNPLLTSVKLSVAVTG